MTRLGNRPLIVLAIAAMTSHCVQTRRPAPYCVQGSDPGMAGAADGKLMTQDVIGGYLVWENYPITGLVTNNFSRAPSLFQVRALASGGHRIVATVDRSFFNLLRVKRAFAYMMMPDGKRARVPLKHPSMAKLAALEAELRELPLINPATISEAVREEAQKDRQSLILEFNRHLRGRKSVQDGILKELNGSAEAGTAAQAAESVDFAKLEFIAFEPDYTPVAMMLPFETNEYELSRNGKYLEVKAQIDASLDLLTEKTLEMEAAKDPILLQDLSVLYDALDWLSRAESNVLSLAVHEALESCAPGDVSAICRKRDRIRPLVDKYFKFYGGNCVETGFDDFKIRLPSFSVFPCTSPSTSGLFSLALTAKAGSELTLADARAGMIASIGHAHGLISGLRARLAEKVKVNGGLLGVRSVVVPSKHATNRVFDELSYAGGIAFAEMPGASGVEMRTATFQTEGTLRTDLRFETVLTDLSKCQTHGAVITLAGLPVTTAKGGCLRFYPEDLAAVDSATGPDPDAKTAEPKPAPTQPATAVPDPAVPPPSPVDGGGDEDAAPAAGSDGDENAPPAPASGSGDEDEGASTAADEDQEEAPPLPSPGDVGGNAPGAGAGRLENAAKPTCPE